MQLLYIQEGPFTQVTQGGLGLYASKLNHANFHQTYPFTDVII